MKELLEVLEKTLEKISERDPQKISGKGRRTPRGAPEGTSRKMSKATDLDFPEPRVLFVEKS